jgi:hypothetical protein
MSHKDRLIALTSKGYFPRELPFAFTTESFGTYVNEILEDWRKAGVFRKKESGKIHISSTGKRYNKRGSYTYGNVEADIEVISKPKKGFERRNIHLTHPIPQTLLNYELAAGWRVLQKWLLRQTYSLDKLHISDQYDRSIKGINFTMHRAKKNYLEAMSDWLVKTDITRFYPSIYTHSIAWAAYGKEKVKSNISLYQGSLADRIDLLVRSCNRNQTVGIPIGPETSRIIAEVISSRIDTDFSERMHDIPKDNVDRLQDDWFIGVESLEKAEKALSVINAVYREYGLEINGSKTLISRIVGEGENQWISEIGAFLSHMRGPVRGSRFRALLSLTLRLQSKFQSEAVINYVLSILEPHAIDVDDIELLESFLLKAAVISPISMDNICRIIINIQHKTKRMSLGRIGYRFLVLAEKNLEKGNLYEVVWLIYTLRGLRIPLNSRRVAELSELIPSSVLSLILLDMKHKGLCVQSLPKSSWVAQISADRVEKDWIWLLAYEGIRHGWLPDPKGVMNKPFFQAMAARNIIFYDERKNVPPSASFVRTKKRARKQDNLDTKKLLSSIRGFNSPGY